MAIKTGPVTAAERLQSLDILRGFALCGILLMNIMFMGGARTGHPFLPATLSDPDWIVWLTQALALEGTMRGLFTLLFGAGMLLMARRTGAEAADVYFRRCLMLLAFGAANVVILLWPADALFIYGLSGAVVFVFRDARPRTLLLVAAAVLLAVSVKSGMDDRAAAAESHHGQVAAELRAAGAPLSASDSEAADNWDRRLRSLEAPSPRMEGDLEKRRGGWLSVMAWSWSIWTTLFLQNLLADLVLESVGFMLVGVALYKLGVLTGERSWRVYAAMAAAGYALGMTVNGWQIWTDWSAGFAPDVWISRVPYQFDRLAVTVGHAGMVLLAWRLDALGGAGAVLAAIGRLGLTNYLGQSALTSLFFYGFGFVGRFGWAELWGVCAAVLILQAIFSVLYLRAFRIGPAEWLLRTVAYGGLRGRG